MNIISRTYKEKGQEFFDPTRFSIEFNCEKYFELLKDWKLKNEKKYLEENPYLNFSPHRHKKILGKPRPTMTGFFFFVILYYFRNHLAIVNILILGN